MYEDQSTRFLKTLLRAKSQTHNTVCKSHGMCVRTEDINHASNELGYLFLHYGKMPIALRHLTNLWLLCRSKAHMVGFALDSREEVQFQMVHFTLLDSLFELRVIDHLGYDFEVTEAWGLYVSYCGDVADRSALLDMNEKKHSTHEECIDELYVSVAGALKNTIH